MCTVGPGWAFGSVTGPSSVGVDSLGVGGGRGGGGEEDEFFFPSFFFSPSFQTLLLSRQNATR